MSALLRERSATAHAESESLVIKARLSHEHRAPAVRHRPPREMSESGSALHSDTRVSVRSGARDISGWLSASQSDMSAAFSSMRRAVARVVGLSARRGATSASRPEMSGTSRLRISASFSSSARARESSSSPGLFEFRVCSVKPGAMDAYLAACAAHAETRARLEPGFLGAFRTSTGGELNEITRVTHFADYDARDATSAAKRADPAWRAFCQDTESMLEKHTSEMYLPATPCLEAIAKSPSDANAFSRWRAFFHENDKKHKRAFDEKPGVFELRAYQLELGYNPIPKLVAHMAEGLPSKLASDPDENGALVGMFYSDVGRLNRFVEVWRYDSAQKHIAAREAARGAQTWRACVGHIAPMVQMFDTKLTEPTRCSPTQ